MGKYKIEALGFTRYMMVISSFSPLFALWILRGSSFNKWCIFEIICGLLILIPNLILLTRVIVSKKRDDTYTKTIGNATDNKEHLLIYLFAMLFPLYSVPIDNLRGLLSAIFALVIITLIFWYFNLHYINIIFAVFHYNVYTIYPPEKDDGISGKDLFIILSKRPRLDPYSNIVCLRLSNTVYIEKDAS